MMTTISDATATGAAQSPVAQAIVSDTSEMPRQTLPESFPTFGGLAELVSDNAALGEALQTLVDALDIPRQADAEAKPVIVDATLVAAANMKPIVAEKLLVRGESEVVALPQSAAEATAVVADSSVAADKPVVAGATSKPKAAADTTETVVLQAASIVSAPLAESVAPVREMSIGAVSAVSGVAPVDISDMFLAAAEEVAAAVKVSPALMRGEAGEIRVQLRSDVLEGAEVVVAVDGKKMDVTFVPTVTHVADTVAANQSFVQQQLAARIAGFEISVAVAQTVATNVSVGVASSASAQAAVARARRTNGRA